MSIARLLRGLVVVIGILGLASCGPTFDGDDSLDGEEDAQVSDFDKDDDTISDEDEGAPATDTDSDGTPDFADDDSDDDGVLDSTEAGDEDLNTRPFDSDGDGLFDFRDTDSDGNGRPDGVDGTGDTDGDGALDFAEADDDGDLLTDSLELGSSIQFPTDTDDDGTPDFRDLDSDGDTIYDRDETALDPDGDGTGSFRDSDSDDDCLMDAVEAGDDDPATAPSDTDLDNQDDYLDLDSDNDGLSDTKEDISCDGSVDAGESSPLMADTDGDGVTDLIEVAAGTDPGKASDNPQANGDFVFTVPYEGVPSPDTDTLDFSTSIAQADVFFVMDTTGSMSGEIANLKTSLASIISTLATDIASVAIGVGGYDDFPTGTCGSGSDEPWYLLHRVMTVSTADGLTSVQNKVNALATHNGADAPESGWQALHHIATGSSFSGGATTVSAFDPATAYPATPSAGETTGDLGGVGFRAGSLPIVVWITDMYNHNSDTYTTYDYDATDSCADIPGASRSSDTISELVTLGARVIAVIAGSSSIAKNDAKAAVEATGAKVEPLAWGTGLDRPSGCDETKCCTGASGAGETPDSLGMCPLTFTISNTGTGLSSAITTAIKVLTEYAVIDIRAQIADDPTDTVDAVTAFVSSVEADPDAGAPCASGLTAIDGDGDAILDTFVDVTPGAQVCFNVIPKANTLIMPTSEPQMFKATISVVGDDVTTLDSRYVYFLVPPETTDVPLP